MQDRLTELTLNLRNFGGDTAEAKPIHAAMLDVIAQASSRGHDIGVDTTYYARPRKKAAGPARDLIDISRSARKALKREISWQDWVTAWARLPATTRQLVWQPPLKQTKRSRTVDRKQLLGYSASGFTMIAPKPATVFPAIEAELARMKTTPRSKHRKPDAAARTVLAAVWRAFQTIPGSSKSPRSPRYLEFGQAVDKIYDTDLFDVKVAGRRFRRLR